MDLDGEKRRDEYESDPNHQRHHRERPHNLNGTGQEEQGQIEIGRYSCELASLEQSTHVNTSIASGPFGYCAC